MPEISSSTARLFADDSLVYRTIRTKEDQALLQEDHDKLQKWERDWLMQFNPDKCEVIRITNKRSPHQQVTASMTLNHAKYLGVTVSSDLSWNKHVEGHSKFELPEAKSTRLSYRCRKDQLQVTRDAHIRILFLCMGPTYPTHILSVMSTDLRWCNEEPPGLWKVKGPAAWHRCWQIG